MKTNRLILGIILSSLPFASLFADHKVELNGYSNGRSTDSAIYRGTDATHNIVRAGKNLDGTIDQTFTLSSEIERVLRRNELVPVRRFREVKFQDVHKVPKTFYRIVCEEVQTRGKLGKGLNAFYAAPKDEKAEKLSQAIKGIGIPTAEKLIARGYFGGTSKKPANWEEFSQIIESASEENADMRTLASTVLDKYGDENRKHLGYFIPEVCRMESYTKMVWEEFTNSRNEEYIVDELQTREFSEPFKTESREIQVTGPGGKLLNGEQETVVVHFNGKDVSVEGNTGYNTYTVNKITEDKLMGTVKIELGVQRKPVTASNTLSVTPHQEADGLKLRVNDRGFDKDGSGQGIVNYKVMQYIPSGRIFGVGSETKELANGSANLDANQAISDIPLNVSRGQNDQIWVEYSLQRSGTPFYNSNSTQTLKTDKQ